MKKLVLLPFLLITTFLSTKPLYALQLERPCRINEEYFEAESLNRKDYTRIREETFLGEKGYCIDTEEYCLKNECDSSLTLRRFLSFYFHLNNIIVNFFLNIFLILLLFLIEKVNLKLFFKFKSLTKVVVITLLAYFSKLIALYNIILPTLNIYSFLEKPSLDYWPTKIVTLLPAAFVIIAISILVSIIFYSLYSKILSLERKKRVFYSFAFGILSNPIWYIIYKVFLGNKLL